MEAGVAKCDPDKVNDDLMHLKYNHKINPSFTYDSQTQTLIIGS